jgi:ankyrin repeat protein
MTLRSIIDPKKKALVRAALKRGDSSILKKKKKPVTKPMVEEPAKEEPKTKTPAAQIRLIPKRDLRMELHDAVRDCDIEKIKDLIQQGANIESRYGNDRTLLMDASKDGNIEIVELLIKLKANINATDNYGQTALKWALGKGNTDVVDLLRKHGAKE